MPLPDNGIVFPYSRERDYIVQALVLYENEGLEDGLHQSVHYALNEDELFNVCQAHNINPYPLLESIKKSRDIGQYPHTFVVDLGKYRKAEGTCCIE